MTKIQWTQKQAAWSLAVSLSILVQISSTAAESQNWSSLYTDGTSQLQQQKLNAAESSFRQALSLVKEQSKNPADTEQCMLKLADTLALEEKISEAQSIYQQLLDILVKRYGSSSSKLAPVLMALGSIQESEGDHTTAMQYYNRALKINERSYGPYSPGVVSVLHRLGNANCASGSKEDARKHYNRALTALLQDPSLAASKEMESLIQDYHNLIQGNDNSNRQLIKDFNADILPDNKAVAGNAGVVQAPLRPAITPQANTDQSAWQKQSGAQRESTRQWQSNEDPQIIARSFPKPASEATMAPAYKVLNDSIFKQNHYEKGESYYQRMIATDIDSLGPYHPSVANDLTGLALLYVGQHKYAEAQPLLMRALSIYQQAYGTTNLLTINTRVTLGSVEFRLGHADKAAELFRSALTQGQSVLGPNSFETASILNELAYLYYHQGKLEEARTFYGWALSSTEGALGKDDPLVAACLKDYAQVLRSMGNSADAESMDLRAQKILAAAK